ncbi:RnfH family protein [Photobacterium sp. ZSDE20]|uniref:UPF0125 protein NHN17_11020 n=1 Tax=Photobacterium pectinilyticum TaxID=2906793 RepID=A0ABT1N225_9GAMM|nr:RnfH family protein [Photobacterium sp. ZSDE20]MCQ1058592.1 RnfH family protein [Photobacterium sp. ZSDE20]MDD1826286.1 RnfH family protein [Photobacterium sp. ZSDE20]
MNVSVVYALPSRQAWLPVTLADEATVLMAIQQSGILNLFPDIDLSVQKVGVFGKMKALDAVIEEGDRIEIYRPIVWKPTDDDEL